MSTLRVNNLTDAGGTGSTYAKGHIVQIQKATDFANVATTSTSLVDTGIAMSFTPKNASSLLKITVTFQAHVYAAGSVQVGGAYAITDSSNNKISGEASVSYYDGSSAERNMSAMTTIVTFVNAVDTSTRTYKLRYKTFNTRAQINNAGDVPAQFVIEEIAA